MTQQGKGQAPQGPRKGFYAYWFILMVTALPALYVVVSNTLFREQPIVDTIVTVLALAVLMVLAVHSFRERTYRVMRFRDALKDWSCRVGKALPFMLMVYGALSWTTGSEPAWWYITTTGVGALGTLVVLFWWYLKEIAPRTV